MTQDATWILEAGSHINMPEQKMSQVVPQNVHIYMETEKHIADSVCFPPNPTVTVI